MALNPSEDLVESLCKRSFLSLWSISNPSGPAGKELCDLLVVCEPHVLVFSVKDIGLPEPPGSVDVVRWRRKAIHQSVKQLYGAERKLATMEAVSRHGSGPHLRLPARAHRRIHRIAVALGSGGMVPFDQSDFSKGFVHVLDDRSLRTVMAELDTIADFVGYLEAKEELLRASKPLFTGGESDLLAIYIHRGRKFPTPPTGLTLAIDNGSWNDLASKPEWARRKAADEESYIWDSLIENVTNDVLGPGLEFGSSDGAERSLRVMAREDRFARRLLGNAFNDFMALAAANKVRSRQVVSPSGVHYVFLAYPHDYPRELRASELKGRCVVVRDGMSAYAPVLGLATEQYKPGVGHSIDVVYLDLPEWTPEHRSIAAKIREDSGFFVEPLLSVSSHEEYPQEG